ncbi:hypothetical protein DSL92_05845 [Billgrantia gudaonensis]|uniref:Uncharacterized protein n=1 Tax=Billgrantia gudaonensis TaxID=376427 RepID=A0A3S0QRQ1_9GAMM|nr:hypothetical protein DSL92_05845 [Halomonas gudaonensis]
MAPAARWTTAEKGRPSSRPISRRQGRDRRRDPGRWRCAMLRGRRLGYDAGARVVIEESRRVKRVSSSLVDGDGTAAGHQPGPQAPTMAMFIPIPAAWRLFASAPVVTEGRSMSIIQRVIQLHGARHGSGGYPYTGFPCRPR